MQRLGGWTQCQELKEMRRKRGGMQQEQHGLIHDFPPLQGEVGEGLSCVGPSFIHLVDQQLRIMSAPGLGWAQRRQRPKKGNDMR